MPDRALLLSRADADADVVVDVVVVVVVDGDGYRLVTSLGSFGAYEER